MICLDTRYTISCAHRAFIRTRMFATTRRRISNSRRENTHVNSPQRDDRRVQKWRYSRASASFLISRIVVATEGTDRNQAVKWACCRRRVKCQAAMKRNAYLDFYFLNTETGAKLNYRDKIVELT